MFLLINKKDPQAKTPVVTELTELIVCDYQRGLIDIVDPTNMVKFCGNWEQPDWEPIDE